jgi:hypothetical protein
MARDDGQISREMMRRGMATRLARVSYKNSIIGNCHAESKNLHGICMADIFVLSWMIIAMAHVSAMYSWPCRWSGARTFPRTHFF